MKPVKELVKEVGDINKCKFILNQKYKEEYEKIIEKYQRITKQNNITLVDFIFYDTIYEKSKKYYEGFIKRT